MLQGNTTETYYQLEGLINDQSYTVGVSAVYTGNFESEIVELDFVYTGVGTDDQIIQIRTELGNNYPNPFNPVTKISYAVSEACRVSIDIFNIKGEKVKALIRERKDPSYYQTVWNGKDDTGKTVSSGVYFYQTKIGDYKSCNKMLLMK